MYDEHLLAINPIVAESVVHNARTLSTLRSLTSPLLGLCAGALRLESTLGFAFYIAGTLFTSVLIYIGPAQRSPERFFGGVSVADVVEIDGALTSDGAGSKAEPGSGPTWQCWREMALGGVGLESFMGFVMAWTLVFNLCGT